MRIIIPASITHVEVFLLKRTLSASRSEKRKVLIKFSLSALLCESGVRLYSQWTVMICNFWYSVMTVMAILK